MKQRDTVVFPKEGEMRFAGQASRSNKSTVFWTVDYRIGLFLDVARYLRKLALLTSSPTFGYATVTRENDHAFRSKILPPILE
jgi:hypothetical protein